jgi:hypothetical protein
MIESCCFIVLGIVVIKSIVTTSHFHSGMRNYCNILDGCVGPSIFGEDSILQKYHSIAGKAEKTRGRLQIEANKKMQWKANGN